MQRFFSKFIVVNTMSTLKPPVSAEDHILGSINASVILTEYGDFDCPHCAIAHVFIKKLLLKFKDQIAFVFRHFPLAKVHQYAAIAHLIRSCSKSGKVLGNA